MSKQETVRRRNYDAVMEEFGRATECDPPPEQLPRMLLLEEDSGPADNGGPWHEFGDDPAEVLRAACGQEEPWWWPPFLVVDLDSGERYDVETEEYTEPDWAKPGMKARVVVDQTVISAEA